MQIDMSPKFTDPDNWHKIDGMAKALGVSGGVYRVHAGNDESTSSDFREIQRLLKPDPHGLLYIGMANTFTVRFIELMKAINPGYLSDGHAFARSYNSLDAVKIRFPVGCLRFTLRFSDNPAKVEYEELTAYRKEFGELPPFNASQPGVGDVA